MAPGFELAISRRNRERFSVAPPDRGIFNEAKGVKAILLISSALTKEIKQMIIPHWLFSRFLFIF